MLASTRPFKLTPFNENALSKKQRFLRKQLFNSNFGPLFMVLQIILLGQESATKQRLAKYYAIQYTEQIRRIVTAPHEIRPAISLEEAIKSRVFTQADYLSKVLSQVFEFKQEDNTDEFWDALQTYLYQSLNFSYDADIIKTAYADLLTAYELSSTHYAQYLPGGGYKLSNEIYETAQQAFQNLQMPGAGLEIVKQQIADVKSKHVKSLLFNFLQAFLFGVGLVIVNNSVASVGQLGLGFTSGMLLPLIFLLKEVLSYKTQNISTETIDECIDRFKQAYTLKSVKLLVGDYQSGYHREVVRVSTAAKIAEAHASSVYSPIMTPAPLPEPVNLSSSSNAIVYQPSTTSVDGNYHTAKPNRKRPNRIPSSPAKPQNISEISFVNGIYYTLGMHRRIVRFEINHRIMECLMVKVENEQGSIQYAALNITALKQQNVSDDEMKIFKNAFGNAGWVKINNWEFSNGAKVHSKLRPNATGARIASHEVPATSGPASITARSSLLLFDCYVKSKLAHSNNPILPTPDFG